MAKKKTVNYPPLSQPYMVKNLDYLIKYLIKEKNISFSDDDRVVPLIYEHYQVTK